MHRPEAKWSRHRAHNPEHPRKSGSSCFAQWPTTFGHLLSLSLTSYFDWYNLPQFPLWNSLPQRAQHKQTKSAPTRSHFYGTNRNHFHTLESTDSRTSASGADSTSSTTGTCLWALASHQGNESSRSMSSLRHLRFAGLSSSYLLIGIHWIWWAGDCRTLVHPRMRVALGFCRSATSFCWEVWAVHVGL